MFGDGSLSFHEFATREPHPLARIHDAVLDFLRGRTDAVLYGAQAVNAYVDESRMTQDVDIATTRAADLAKELRRFLSQKFHIAVRVCVISMGIGYRVYQPRKPKNRHLIDLRPIDVLPPCQRVKKVLVATPPELIASKVVSMVNRSRKPKGFMDEADLRRLLLTFPELKTDKGPVSERLRAVAAPPEVWKAWKELVRQRIESEKDEDEFDY